MGSIWLSGRTVGYPNVVDVLRAAGVNVETFEGWETRSRSSGGFEAFLGVVCHHTASQTTPQNDLHFMVYGSPDAPVSNGLLDRTGTFTIIAAGASNHAGKGGGSSSGGGAPWYASKGQVPPDSANSRCFGIEAANNGVGEPWPQAQQDAYVKMVRALCDAYGFVVDSDVRSHEEWTPPRKCDPTGPSRFAPPGNGRGCNGADLWSMPTFRAEVVAGGQPKPDEEELVLTIIEVDGAGAKFLGFMSEGLGHAISWLDTQAKVDLYRAHNCPVMTVGLADLKNLWLLGPVPSGDMRHDWKASDFAP